MNACDLHRHPRRQSDRRAPPTQADQAAARKPPFGRRKSSWQRCSCFCGGIQLGLLLAGCAADQPTFAVHVVDVGCGLAVFVEGPDFSLVYDAGSLDELAMGADNRFVAYLNALRPVPRRIDHIVVSHPHADHVSLLPDVLARHEIGQIWDPGAMSENCAYPRLLLAVQGSGAAYHTAVTEEGDHSVPLASSCRLAEPDVTLRYGARLVPGSSQALGRTASMRFLYANGAPSVNANDNSMVVRLDLGGHRVLLMGDASAGQDRDPSEPPDPGSIEAQLLETPRELDADVLVVGYHGRRAASRAAFLNAVSPDVSVVPSCPRNGPPDAAVLRELAARGDVFRTDIDDTACGADPTKVGVPADGLPGGCSNIKIVLRGNTKPLAGYWKRPE